MSRQLEISREINQKHIGRTLKVLIDGFAGGDTSRLFGRTAFQAPEIDGVVTIDEGAADPGTLVDVRITDAGDYDLRGMIV
jgi:ribosomal protein S12 methylthiotransferase